MYYFILIVLMVSSGLSVFTADKYLEFKRIKELFKANICYKICLGSGAIAMLLILILMFIGE